RHLDATRARLEAAPALVVEGLCRNETPGVKVSRSVQELPPSGPQDTRAIRDSGTDRWAKYGAFIALQLNGPVVDEVADPRRIGCGETMSYTPMLNTTNLDGRCPTCHAEGRRTAVTVSASGRIMTYSCQMCGYTWEQAQRELSAPMLFAALVAPGEATCNS